MSFVTVACAECGPVEIALDEVVLRVCEDDSSATCVAPCSQCGMRIVKCVDDGTNLLLAMFGVRIETWHLPAELDERPHGCAPISLADIDAFRTTLYSGQDLLPLAVPPPR